MNNVLVKMRRAVDMRGIQGPAVQDVRAATLTFGTYKYVLLVVLIASLYYLLIASDRYVTRAQVYVKSTGGGVAVAQQLQLLGSPPADLKDTQLVQAFIVSQDMLKILEEKIKFSEHFSSSDWDFYSRMSESPSDEARLKYFRKHLSATLNPDTGMINIKAQGFTPELSLQMVEEAIKSSEAFVNSIGQRIALEEIAFVEKEMARAQENLATARAKLLRFQNENGLLSAEAAGASRQAMVNEMESELVRMETREKTLSSYLNPAASELISVRSRIEALTEQLVIEREKLASRDGISVNDVNAQYQALELELQFATDLYQTTLVSLERARIESYKKLKHLVVVQSPQLPDEALEPRKLYNIATLFVALSLAYGIITMIVATIREHRDV